MQEIKISGDIVAFNCCDGDFSIKNLEYALANLTVADSEDIVIGINTYGGDVDAGFSMYNILRRFAKENNVTITTRLDGYCSSIGTVILLAGDKRIGNEYSSPFVHNAWTMAVGDANEMKKVFLDLQAVNNKIAKFYSDKINIDIETAKNLMQSETWIEPTDALAYGFFTELENTATPSKAFFNLLKENNLLRKNTNSNINLNKNKMNDNSKSIVNKIIGLIEKGFSAKNKIVFDAENLELDFYELADSDTEKVGDKANYKGQPATGEILIQSGETYVFDDGTLTEIKAVAESDTALADALVENEILKEKVAILEATATSNATNLLEIKNQLSKLKDVESGFNANNKQNGKPAPITNAGLIDKIKNLK
jgi:ATP-dependent protease ClpP protease subunit